MTDPVSLSRALCSQIVKSCEKAHGRDLGKKVEDIAKQTFGGDINLRRLNITPEVFKEYTPEQLLTLATAFEAAGRPDLADQCSKRLPLFSYSDDSVVTDIERGSSLSQSSQEEESTTQAQELKLECEAELCDAILSMAHKNQHKIRGEYYDLDEELKRDVSTGAKVILGKIGVRDFRLNRLHIDERVLEKYHGKKLADLAFAFRRLERNALAERCDAIIEQRAQCQHQLCEAILNGEAVDTDAIEISEEIFDGYNVKELVQLADRFRGFARSDLADKCDAIVKERQARCMLRLCYTIGEVPRGNIDDQQFRKEVQASGNKVFNEFEQKTFDIDSVEIDEATLREYNSQGITALAAAFQRLGRPDLSDKCHAVHQDRTRQGQLCREIMKLPFGSIRDQVETLGKAIFNNFDINNMDIDENVIESFGKHDLRHLVQAFRRLGRTDLVTRCEAEISSREKRGSKL